MSDLLSVLMEARTVVPTSEVATLHMHPVLDEIPLLSGIGTPLLERHWPAVTVDECRCFRVTSQCHVMVGVLSGEELCRRGSRSNRMQARICLAFMLREKELAHVSLLE